MKLFEFLRPYLQGDPVYDANGTITGYEGGLNLTVGITDILIATAFAIFMIVLTVILLFVSKRIIRGAMNRRLKRIKIEEERLQRARDKDRRDRKISEINTMILHEVKTDSPYKYVDVSKRAETIARTTYKIIAAVVWLVVVIIILDGYSINVIPLITGAGIIGIAVAFGAQEFVKDFISGLFNIFENTYSVGESVEIHGFVGTVREIGLRTTKIEDWTGDYLIINNGQINKVLNRSRDTSTAIVDILLSNKVKIDEARKAFKDFVDTYQSKNPNILEPLTFVGLTESTLVAYNFRVITTTPPASHKAVEREIRIALVEYLENLGFEGPQQTIIVNQ